MLDGNLRMLLYKSGRLVCELFLTEAETSFSMLGSDGNVPGIVFVCHTRTWRNKRKTNLNHSEIMDPGDGDDSHQCSC